MAGRARLSHLDAAGRARMVDVGDKAVTARLAVAGAVSRMSTRRARRREGRDGAGSVGGGAGSGAGACSCRGGSERPERAARAEPGEGSGRRSGGYEVGGHEGMERGKQRHSYTV